MGQLTVEEPRRIGEVTSVSEMKLPEKLPVLRVAPMPADVNQNGDIFGGWVMSLVDIAGGLVAQLRARGRVVTVGPAGTGCGAEAAADGSKTVADSTKGLAT